MKVQSKQSSYPNSPNGRMKELKDSLNQHPDVFRKASEDDSRWLVTGMNGRQWQLYVTDKGGSALENASYGSQRAFHSVRSDEKGFSVRTEWAVSGESYMGGGRSERNYRTSEKLSARDQFTMGLKVLGSLTGIPFDLYAPGLAARPVSARES